MATKTKRIKIQCDACEGSGVYQGFAEPPGEAVVCLPCEGDGWYWFRYKPFEGRRRRRGIKRVSLSRGNFIVTGVGALGESISYSDFCKGKMPVKAASDE